MLFIVVGILIWFGVDYLFGSRQNSFHAVILVGIVAGVAALEWVLFPYVTSFDLVTRGQRCRRCGYDLYGIDRDHCPECGLKRNRS